MGTEPVPGSRVAGQRWAAVINDLAATINSFAKGSHAHTPVIYLPRRLSLGGYGQSGLLC